MDYFWDSPNEFDHLKPKVSYITSGLIFFLVLLFCFFYLLIYLVIYLYIYLFISVFVILFLAILILTIFIKFSQVLVDVKKISALFDSFAKDPE